MDRPLGSGVRRILSTDTSSRNLNFISMKSCAQFQVFKNPPPSPTTTNLRLISGRGVRPFSWVCASQLQYMEVGALNASLTAIFLLSIGDCLGSRLRWTQKSDFDVIWGLLLVKLSELTETPATKSTSDASDPLERREISMTWTFRRVISQKSRNQKV